MSGPDDFADFLDADDALVFPAPRVAQRYSCAPAEEWADGVHLPSVAARRVAVADEAARWADDLLRESWALARTNGRASHAKWEAAKRLRAFGNDVRAGIIGRGVDRQDAPDSPEVPAEPAPGSIGSDRPEEGR